MNLKLFALFLSIFLCVSVAFAENSIKIQNGQFTQNGKPIFLLGISYFDGLSAPPRILKSDLDFLKSKGFNALRVWVNWYTEFQPNTIGLIESDGSLNPEILEKLKSFLSTTQNNGFIVKLTFSRHAADNISFQNYRQGILEVTSKISKFSNVLFDLQNETDHCNENNESGCEGHLTMQQAGELADAVKKVDPKRLVTVSRTGSGFNEGQDDYQTFLNEAKVDFIATHRPSRTRDHQWAENTAREMREARKQIGNEIPVLFDEPNRCGRILECKERSDALQFLTAAKQAKESGAAGWFFHTSAGFRLHSRPLLERLNTVEKIAVNRLAKTIEQATTNTSGGL